MGRFAPAALVRCSVCFAVLAMGGTLTAQKEHTFSVDVRLVRVLATVKDAAGRLIGDLRREDFTILDNGAKQEIRLFERQSAVPLSISLMVDVSGSTAKDLKYEVDSVNRFLRELFREGNPDDRLSLFSFNWEVRNITRFCRNLAELDRGLKGMKAEAGTAMYDAIKLGSEELDLERGRHVMVMVTDGGDTVSTTTYQQALSALHRADTVFYAVLVVPIHNDAGRNVGGENALATLSQSTGGRVFLPTIGESMNQAFDQILRELRTQYLLGYYPHNTPLSRERFHRIQVTVAGPQLQVLSRTGYYGDALR